MGNINMKTLTLIFLAMLCCADIVDARSDKMEIYDDFDMQFCGAKNMAGQTWAYAIESLSRMRQLKPDFTTTDFSSLKNMFDIDPPGDGTRLAATGTVFPISVDKTLFVLAKGGDLFFLMKSVDGGAHYGANPPTFDDNSPVLYLGADPATPQSTTGQNTNVIVMAKGFCEATIDGNTVLFLGEYPGKTGKRLTLWKSTDLGTTWTSAASWPNTPTVVADHFHAVVQNPHDLSKIYLSFGDSIVGNTTPPIKGGIIVWDGKRTLHEQPDQDSGWVNHMAGWSNLDFLCTANYVFTGPEMSTPSGLYRYDSSLSLNSRVKIYDPAANYLDDPMHGFGIACTMPDGTLIFTRCCGSGTINRRSALVASVDDGATWKVAAYYTMAAGNFNYVQNAFPFGGKLVLSSASAAGKSYSHTTIITVSGLIKNGETPKIVEPVYYIQTGGSDLINNWLYGTYKTTYVEADGGHIRRYGSKQKPWATLQWALNDGGLRTTLSTNNYDADSRVVNGSRIIVKLNNNQIDVTSSGTIFPVVDNFKVGFNKPSGRSGPVIIEGGNAVPLVIKNTDVSWAYDSLFSSYTRDTAVGSPSYSPDGLGFHNCELTNAKAGTNASLVQGIVNSIGSGGAWYFENCKLGLSDVSYGKGLFWLPRALLQLKNSTVLTAGSAIIETVQPQISNTLFIGGDSLIDSVNLGAVFNSYQWIYNCTFTGQTTAIINFAQGSTIVPAIKNCIFAPTSGYAIADQAGMTETSAIGYNCVYGGDGYSDISAAAMVGNVTGDPKFVSTTAGAEDLRLFSDSPCIDAGTSDNAPLIDMDGIPRPQGAGFDMGAYEYHGVDITTTTVQPTTSTTSVVLTSTTTSLIIDIDGDGIPDADDNCQTNPNGPTLGTCSATSDKSGVNCDE